MTVCKNCSKALINKRSIYCSNKCQNAYQLKKIHEEFLNGGYAGKELGFSKNEWARKFLVDYLGEVCNSCDITEYNGKPITLEVNHIDGRAFNNVIENLEFLCPNCHSQTPTYGYGSSRKSDRKNRRK